MNDILVAGAGHGGIAAAKHLAENGYKVTVIEKKAERELGYDWLDCIYIKSFDDNGFEITDKSILHPFGDIAYKSNSKSVTVSSGSGVSDILFMAERKKIISHMISAVKTAGVEFVFGKEIVAPIEKNNCICGVKTADGEEIFASAVIDACGVESPVRKNLPEKFGIMREFNEKDIFNVYRAHYAKTENKFSSPRYTIFLNHCGKCGMDWAVTEDGYIDILVGKFGKLTNSEIEAAVADFKKEYPYMDDRILRGGSIEKIPLRRTLPVIVCSGYAAVGDSASMTEPLSGSGIAGCLTAGKMLAETIISAGGDTTLASLWKYQYEYFMHRAKNLMAEDIIRNLMKEMSAKDIDFLFERGIITSKELFGGSNKYSLSEVMKKAAILLRPHILKKGIAALCSIKRIDKVFDMLPAEYDAEEVAAWIKEYESL